MSLTPFCCRFYGLACVPWLLHNIIEQTTHEADDEDRRRQANRLFDAADQPVISAGTYRFFNREYFVITYRTDPEALAAVVPEPLEVTDSVVKYEFIRMPIQRASAITPKPGR